MPCEIREQQEVLYRDVNHEMDQRNPQNVIDSKSAEWNGRTCSLVSKNDCHCHYISIPMQKKILDNIEQNNLHQEDGIKGKIIKESLEETIAATHLHRKHRKHIGNNLNVFHESAVPSNEPVIRIYDARNTYQPNYILVETNEDSRQTSLATNVQNAFSGAQTVQHILKGTFGWDSINGRHMADRSNVNVGRRYDNAYWDGQQMWYGNGDGYLFADFTADTEVNGHEHFHGVTQYRNGLTYHKQPGAENESWSDWFGSIFEQAKKNQVAFGSFSGYGTADWWIGDVVLKGAGALRTMTPGKAYINNPYLGTDDQPKHIADYQDLPDTEDGDWGGVHVNSGIPNRAKYEVVKYFAEHNGGLPVKLWEPGCTIAKVMWDTHGKVQYNAKFQDEANMMYSVALTYPGGQSSLEAQSVVAGWTAAGITPVKVSLF